MAKLLDVGVQEQRHPLCPLVIIRWTGQPLVPAGLLEVDVPGSVEPCSEVDVESRREGRHLRLAPLVRLSRLQRCFPDVAVVAVVVGRTSQLQPHQPPRLHCAPQALGWFGRVATL